MIQDAKATAKMPQLTVQRSLGTASIVPLICACYSCTNRYTLQGCSSRPIPTGTEATPTKASINIPSLPILHRGAYRCLLVAPPPFAISGYTKTVPPEAPALGLSRHARGIRSVMWLSFRRVGAWDGPRCCKFHSAHTQAVVEFDMTVSPRPSAGSARLDICT